MPSAHRRYAEWTPARMMREAAKIGPATIALVEAIMTAKPHPEQGFRACLGILRLAQQLRLGAHRGRLPPRQRHRRDHLRLDQIDPAAWARSCLRQREAAGRAADPTPQHPRHWLLPLRKGETMLDTSHPRPPRYARAHRHGEGARRTATTARHCGVGLRGTACSARRPRSDRAREQTADQPLALRKPQANRPSSRIST